MTALSAMDRSRILARNNVSMTGQGRRTLVFAHGLGCDQTMWRFVVQDFVRDSKVVLLDHVGSGRSDRNAFRIEKHGSLQGYVDDLLEVCDALDLEQVVLIGHSVSGMLGLLAAQRDPQRFTCIVMVGPSPRYIDDHNYVGGFSRPDVDELLELLETNHEEWSRQMAPQIMNRPDRPELAQELANSFCRMDPLVARYFARATFLCDFRSELPNCAVPTLIMQCTGDILVPVEVGRYLQQHLPDSDLVIMEAKGHCPHMSAPAETIAVIRDYLDRLDERRSGAR